jgi:hypothetical protein
MSGNTAVGFRPKFWVPGDWNALFVFDTNILVNVLVLTGLLRFALKMPDALVFSRILPALGMMLFLSTGYYAFLAWALARKTGRSDVCALPFGISVPHMFVITFVAMLPIKLATNDPVQAWEAGLTWVAVQSFVLMLGGFIGPYIRDHPAGRPARLAGRYFRHVYCHKCGGAGFQHARHRHRLFRCHSGQLVRRRALLRRRLRRAGGDRGGNGHCLGIHRHRPGLRRPEPCETGRINCQFRLFHTAAGVQRTPAMDKPRVSCC